uniref:SNARE-interacting protein KEULE-like n=1 Tax=Tanacetum cinerariifolium TaxID=118510 RepID=A0A699HLG1_TANCI|nr:SNARE-interacting protein KEULE-like [Tanacetum cinerariifolium]
MIYPVWMELCPSHIADANERLHDKMTSFVSKNKAAQMYGSRGGGELSTRDLQKMVQALPHYIEPIDKLSIHVDIATKINKWDNLNRALYFETLELRWTSTSKEQNQFTKLVQGFLYKKVRKLGYLQDLG